MGAIDPLTFFALIFGMSSAIGLVALGEAARDRRLTLSEILTGVYYISIIVFILIAIFTPAGLRISVSPPLNINVSVPDALISPMGLLTLLVLVGLSFIVFRLLAPSTIVRLVTALLAALITYSLFAGIPFLEMLPFILLVASLGVVVALLLYMATSLASVELGLK
jgi:hypothetical protein